MTEPIPVRVTRHRCPHCPRSYAAKRRCADHIGRCWYNPHNRGCKTCRHFNPAERADPTTGYGGMPEECEQGVDLSGPGPIVGCEQWEARP